MDKAVLKNVCKSAVGWVLMIIAGKIADTIAAEYGYKDSDFAGTVATLILFEFFILKYRHAKLQKETTGVFSPSGMDEKYWQIFKHGSIITLSLAVLFLSRWV